MAKLVVRDKKGIDLKTKSRSQYEFVNVRLGDRDKLKAKAATLGLSIVDFISFIVNNLEIVKADDDGNI